jgi:hypothetical protein
LCDVSRIWKINTSCTTVEHINEQVYETEGKTEYLPLEVNGEILSLTSTIEEVNIADNEILIYEVKLNTQGEVKIPWAMIPLAESGSSKKKQNKNKQF